jgi:hypothetical protein
MGTRRRKNASHTDPQTAMAANHWNNFGICNQNTQHERQIVVLEEKNTECNLVYSGYPSVLPHNFSNLT